MANAQGSKVNSRKLSRNKGRSFQGAFSAWPRACADSPHFAALSIKAKALLFDFLGQYRGFNNGDLSCHWKRMKDRGWRSRDTLEKACRELEGKGWIVRTRQGSLGNRCNLYAITWQSIDACAGKIDATASSVALGFWKQGSNPWLERDYYIRPRRVRKSLDQPAGNPVSA